METGLSRRSGVGAWLLLVATWVGNVVAQPASRFPVPAPASAAQFAAGIPRTARLLQTPGRSDASAEVRVLVYGQSISMQDWWLAVRQFLTERYPNRRLVVENRAIGGFSADRLKRMVENDVVPFYPDLVLLHDYGSPADYEQIIRTIRSRTTAEIAVQTDHIGVGQNDAWHDHHATTTLPQLCRRYGLALIDVRAAWRDYLTRHKLPAPALLTDHVHLNDHGNYLMAEIIKRHFESIGGNVVASGSRGQPDTNVVDIPIRQRSGPIRLPVTGNRIDLVWQASAGRNGNVVNVVIDGQRPTQLPGCAYYTRPALKADGFFLTHIGQPLTVQLGPAAPPEDWTLTVTAVDTVAQQVQFQVRGSQTGPDGAGRSDSRFRSTSGRIQIDSTGWFRRKDPQNFAQFSWVKPGATFRWQTRLLCQNGASANATTMPVTVAQGLTNGEHLLELSGPGLSALDAVRVYRPPLRERP